MGWRLLKMNFLIIGTTEHHDEYKRIIENWNWKTIKQGDRLHTASHSSLYIGDLEVIMRNNDTVTLKYVPEETHCSCCEC
jgi:hypothetical protein